MVIVNSFKLHVRSVCEGISPFMAFVVSFFISLWMLFINRWKGITLLLGSLFLNQKLPSIAFQQTVACTATIQNLIIQWPLGQCSKDFSVLTDPLIVPEDFLWLEAHRNDHVFHILLSLSSSEHFLFSITDHFDF